MRRRRVNLEKAVLMTVIINALQIAGALTLMALSLLTGGRAFEGRLEQAILIIMTIVVISGAAADIREALSARDLALETDMLEDAYEKLGELNGTLRSQRHDFMNHLQVVYSLIELEDYGEAASYIEKVYSDIRRVSRTLRTAHPAINALLAAKSADAENRGIAVTLDIESTWTGLGVESWAMCRVLGNLIDNAMDALKDVPRPRLTIALQETLKTFEFSISNNGPEIPPEAAQNIFRRGFSTKGEGRGMGLSIVKDVMESAGGGISLTSDAHLTTFHGTIPRAAVQPAAEAKE